MAKTRVRKVHYKRGYNNRKLKSQTSKKGSLDRVLFLGGVSGLLYLWISKYEGKILYFGWAEYLIYTPSILLGLILFRKFKGDFDNFFVNWFFRFLMSLLFLYVPLMCIFVGLNILYVRDASQKTKVVSLEKVVSMKPSKARILIEINNETKFIYGYRRELDNIDDHKLSTYKVKLYYKEGIFGTYVIEDYIIY